MSRKVTYTGWKEREEKQEQEKTYETLKKHQDLDNKKIFKTIEKVDDVPLIVRSMQTNEITYDWIYINCLKFQLMQLDAIEQGKKWKKKLDLDKFKNEEEKEFAEDNFHYYQSLFDDKAKHIENTIKKYFGYVPEEVYTLDKLIWDACELKKRKELLEKLKKAEADSLEKRRKN